MFFHSTKLVSKTTKSLVYNSKRSSKRGISEIIGSLILMGITVTGGLLVWTLLQGNEQLTFSLDEIEISPIVIAQLKVTGYDTRDDNNLYGITGLNNQLQPTTAALVLCTTCGVGFVDNEFIILKIRSDNDEAVFINGIHINEVEHVFDTAQSSTSTFTVGTDAPTTGKFIIISGSNGSIIQETGSAIPIGGEKRIVIRLSDSITPNDPTGTTGIALNSQLRVIIDSSVETVQELLIPAGSLA